MRIFAFADEASQELEQQIAAMRRNQLDGLEIRGVDGTNVFDISFDKARQVRSELDAAGLSTWSVGSPVGKVSIESEDFPGYLEKCRRMLEIAHILGTENIRMFSFYIPEGKQPEDYRNAVIDRLGAFVDMAAGSGITLCHENEKGIYGALAPQCLEIHKALPQLAAVFDPANYVQCGQDTLEAWELLHPYVKYMHIKDALADGRIVPAGKGDGNLPVLLRKYQAQGGDVVTMEPHLGAFVGLAELEQAGNTSHVGALYSYADSHAAFDAACDALKALL